MAEMLDLPVRGLTSDGVSVAVAEIDLGVLTQIVGWERFGEAADSALDAFSLTLPKDFHAPCYGDGISVWRIAPDRALIRSNGKLDLKNTNELAVLDLSDARVLLTVEGEGAADLLSRVISLDFSMSSFPPGTFVQTALHHVGVLVERTAADQFGILIPTTWAVSLTQLLTTHLHPEL